MELCLNMNISEFFKDQVVVMHLPLGRFKNYFLLLFQTQLQEDRKKKKKREKNP